MVSLQPQKMDIPKKRGYSSNIHPPDWDKRNKGNDNLNDLSLLQYEPRNFDFFCPDCQKEIKSEQDLIQKEIHTLRCENVRLNKEIVELKEKFKQFEALLKDIGILKKQPEANDLHKNSEGFNEFCNIFKIEEETILENMLEFEDIGGILNRYLDNGDDSVSLIRKMRGGERLDD